MTASIFSVMASILSMKEVPGVSGAAVWMGSISEEEVVAEGCVEEEESVAEGEGEEDRSETVWMAEEDG